MSTFEIKHRHTGAVLYSGEGETLRDVVVAAVKADAYLADANLADANLADANLADAYLAGADLAGAWNVPNGIEQNDPPEPYDRNLSAQKRAERYRQRHPAVPAVPDGQSRLLAMPARSSKRSTVPREPAQ